MQRLIKHTEITLKNKKGKPTKAILEEIEYEFHPLLWTAIKEWAGVYDIGIKWEKKWSDISAYYALKYYCPSINAMTQKKFMAVGKATPEIIRRQVWQDINAYVPAPEYKQWCHSNNDPNDPENWHPVLPHSTQENPQFLTSTERSKINRKQNFLLALHKLAPTFKCPEWIQVGTRIEWWERWSKEYAGRVVAITDTYIKVLMFNSKRISRVDEGYAGITITEQWSEPTVLSTTIKFSSNMKRFRPNTSDTWSYNIPYN